MKGTLYIIPTPIDEENVLSPDAFDLLENACKSEAQKSIFVVEDHFPKTGLYNVLCELIVEKAISTKLTSIAPPLNYDLEVGVSPDFYHRKFGLDAQGIQEAIR